MNVLKQMAASLVAFAIAANVLAGNPSATFASDAAALVKQYSGLGMFSGTVLVTHNGETVFLDSAGRADESGNVFNGGTTRHNLGTLGQQLTATLVHQLVDEGKLRLDDQVGRYLDGFAFGKAENVTIGQLLAHQSGMGDYTNLQEYKVRKRSYNNTEKLLGLVKQQALPYETGTTNPSTSGYVVLGAIIEKVTGESYETNVQQRLAQPLGINITFDGGGAGIAVGFRRYMSGSLVSDHHEKIPASPAGYMYMSAKDWAKFEGAWSAKANVGAADLQSLDFGSSAAVRHLPDGYGVVVFANRNDVAVQVADDLAQLAAGGKLQEAKLPAYQYAYNMLQNEGRKVFEQNYAGIMVGAGYPAQDVNTLVELSERLVAEGNEAYAIKVLKSNTRIFPESARAYESLAALCKDAGYKKLALKHYQTALSLDPTNENLTDALNELTVR